MAILRLPTKFHGAIQRYVGAHDWRTRARTNTRVTRTQVRTHMQSRMDIRHTYGHRRVRARTRTIIWTAGFSKLAMLVFTPRTWIVLRWSSIRYEERLEAGGRFAEYLRRMMTRKEEWAHSHRAVRHHTNEHVASAFRILMGTVLKGTRSYNVALLLEFLAVRMDRYYTRRFVEAASGKLGAQQPPDDSSVSKVRRAVVLLKLYYNLNLSILEVFYSSHLFRCHCHPEYVRHLVWFIIMHANSSQRAFWC